MATTMLLIKNKDEKMNARKMLFFTVFANSCLHRGDADSLTGAWCKSMKLNDGRDNYDTALLSYAQLVLEGKVQDEFAPNLLQGATIKKDAEGKPVDISISEASLAYFDSVDVNAKVTMDSTELMDILREQFIVVRMRGT